MARGGRKEVAHEERGVHARVVDGRMGEVVWWECPEMPWAGIFNLIYRDGLSEISKRNCSLLKRRKLSGLDRSGTRQFTGTGIEEKV